MNCVLYSRTDPLEHSKVHNGFQTAKLFLIRTSDVNVDDDDEFFLIPYVLYCFDDRHVSNTRQKIKKTAAMKQVLCEILLFVLYLFLLLANF